MFQCNELEGRLLFCIMAWVPSSLIVYPGDQCYSLLLCISCAAQQFPVLSRMVDWKNNENNTNHQKTNIIVVFFNKVIILLQLVTACLFCRPGQTWNLSNPLHGQIFSIICLPEKRVNYDKLTFATKQCILG